MPRALEGISVLELAGLGPVSYSTMFLGDLGADVLKIEAPPELGRPSTSPQANEEGVKIAAYDGLNRNKKSVVVDLRTREGVDVFCQLAKTADVVIEGYRPGVTRRLGVDYSTLSKLNPRIIYCSMSGYGQEGPLSTLPGHDINYISMGGALGMIGGRDGAPAIPVNLVGDYAAASLHAVIGIMAGLLARKTNSGQFIDISYTDGVVSLLSASSIEYFRDGVVPKRGKMWLTGAFPFYNVYKTKDGGWLTIGCWEKKFWENLCREFGREDLAEHQWSVGRKRQGIFKFFRSAFLEKTRDDWFSLLASKNIPVGKVYSLDEVFRDREIIRRQMVVDVFNQSLGMVKQVGSAIKLSKTPGDIRFTAPLLGEHTNEVLAGLGCDRRRIEDLRQKKIIM